MARRGAVRRGWGRSARHKRRGAHKRAARKRFPTNAKKYPSTLVIAAQRPASSFRGRIVLQLPRSLLLLARLQTVLPRDGVVVPRRGDGRDRDAHNNGGFTRATRCQHNSRRDCAAAIRVGGAQEQRRQLAAFGDCGASRANAFTLGAGRWGSNAVALPVVTRVARCARIARIAWCAGGPEGVGGRAAAAAAAVAAAAATTSCAANQQKRDSQRRILLCASASGAQAAVPEPLSVHSARAHDRTDTAASANLVPEQTSARKNLLKPKPALSSPL